MSASRSSPDNIIACKCPSLLPAACGFANSYLLMPRPFHPKRDLAAQNAVKKTAFLML
jgi:hypothetical protein